MLGFPDRLKCTVKLRNFASPKRGNIPDTTDILRPDWRLALKSSTILEISVNVAIAEFSSLTDEMPLISRQIAAGSIT